MYLYGTFEYDFQQLKTLTYTRDAAVLKSFIVDPKLAENVIVDALPILVVVVAVLAFRAVVTISVVGMKVAIGELIPITGPTAAELLSVVMTVAVFVLSVIHVVAAAFAAVVLFKIVEFLATPV